MDEFNQIMAEKADALKEIQAGPYSEEQREILTAKANELFAAQISALEESGLQDAADSFADGFVGSFNDAWAGVLSGEKSFAQAFGQAFKGILSQTVKAKVAEIQVEKIAELAGIPMILGQFAAATAAMAAVSFHEGGMVGSPFSSPQDVPALLQTGEAVLSRQAVSDLLTGGGQGQDINVSVQLDGREVGRTFARIDNRMFIPGAL
jgi:hypothetical protein